ncbi:hypothetical protein GOP47_0026756 [Adiantum capillus-veneris]|nr:hypothetical protein GOP47_0026756 [Adiantum capillus-veneris]
MLDMDTPISIDVHPSSPPSRLQSPEPSGTPDLRRLSSHRETTAFGYGRGMLSVESDDASPNYSHRQLDYVETSVHLYGHKNENSFSIKSVSDLEKSGLVVVNECKGDLELIGTSLKSASLGNNWYFDPTTDLISDHHNKEHDQAIKDASRPFTEEQGLNAGAHTKLFNLGEKVNSSQWNQPAKTSSLISIPLKGGRTFFELQKKVEALRSQIIVERSQRQVVAQELNTLRRESEKQLLHKQKAWESKFRELQKEKHNLATRLQKVEMDSPRNRLAQGGEVHLTDEEIRHLRQEIAEQESLIRGYQIENERATESVREVQRHAKERERILIEQNTALASQLASWQASGGPKVSNEVAYASLTESLTLRTELQHAQAREAALISESEKMKEVKKVLESKVADLEKINEMQIMHAKDTTDASCQCMLVSSNDIDCFLSGNPEPKETIGDTECLEVRSLEDDEEKENFTQNVQVKIGAKEENKFQNLRKRMERMKRESESKIRDLKQQLEKKRVASHDSERTSMRRVKELEAQINDIRSFYTKKLKEQAEKASTKRVKRPETTVITPSKIDRMPNSMVQAFHLSQKRVALLEENLKEKEAIIKHLEDNILGLAQARGSEGYCTIKTKSSESVYEPSSLKDKTSPSALNKCLGKGEQSPMHGRLDAFSKIQLETAAMMSSSNTDNPSSRTQTHNEPLIGKNMEPQNKDNSDNASIDHQADSKNTQAIDAPADGTLKKRQEGMDNLGNLVQGMEMPFGVQSQQLQALQEKVLEMESRQTQRELDWQSLLIETKRLVDEERDSAGRKLQLAMEAKNAEIERFKLEVDAILETAIQMRRAQLNKA